MLTAEAALERFHFETLTDASPHLSLATLERKTAALRQCATQTIAGLATNYFRRLAADQSTAV